MNSKPLVVYCVAGVLAFGPGLTVALERSHHIDPFAIPASVDPHSPHTHNGSNAGSLVEQLGAIVTQTGAASGVSPHTAITGG